MARKQPVGESYFFRDRGQMELLRRVLLPGLFDENRSQRSLRFWSAGCAQGQEPYSLAILIDQLLPDHRHWALRIHGTDANPVFIDEARRGIYSPWALRGTDPEIWERYFRAVPRSGNWQLVPEIRAMVEFAVADLLEAPPPEGPFDLILCRNVFIYFEPADVARGLARLAGALRPGGFLLTGHGELHGLDLHGLRVETYPGSVVYRRAPVAPPKKVRPPAKPPTVSPPRPPAKAPPPRRVPPPPPAATPLDEALALYGKGRFRLAARKALEGTRDAAMRYQAECLAAHAFMRAGDYDAARQHAEVAARIRPLEAEPYFLLGVLADEAGDSATARGWLEKAVYLAPDHLPALLVLAGVVGATGDRARERRLLGAAKRLLDATEDDTVIDVYDGATAAQLRQSLGDRLERPGGP